MMKSLYAMVYLTGYTLSALLMSAVLISKSAQAQLSPSELERCAQISSDQLRLQCFDNMVKNIATANLVEPSNEETKAVPAHIAATQTAAPEVSAIVEGSAVESSVAVEDKTMSFGDAHLKKPDDEDDIDNVNFIVESISKLNFDKLKITFTNGQVWHQKDSVVYRLKAGDSVILSNGFGSAVYLTKEGLNKKIRVRRVQ